jgi:serine/threonine-protein kinase
MPVICVKCNYSNRDGARFCNSCGAALDELLVQQGASLPLIGQVLQGRYHILEPIGRGGMGAIYLAEHTVLRGQVAVKEMVDTYSDPTERAQAIEQFQSEARLLYTLKHPNLPRVFEYFEDGGCHYLVMDYIEGETLERILERTNGPLPEAQVLGWAEQICDVLVYLHTHKPPIIFRDLKPSNIMLDTCGTVKLIDFGIARIFNPGKHTDTLKMGTPGYASPEQYGGQGQTLPQSDLYALGATLHQLLTCRDPSVQLFTFPPVRTINPAVSQGTEAVLVKALQSDLALRFQTAEEMKRALLTGSTLKCPQCGHANDSSEIYCQQCGILLSGKQTCRHCGRSIPAKTRFCPKCGRPT